jgi:hypothetical protein
MLCRILLRRNCWTGSNENRTLRGVADGWPHVLEPLDLRVQGPRVPDRLPEPARHEKWRVQRRGARDGEVGATVERRVVRLGRRQQRQPQLLRCSSIRHQNQNDQLRRPARRSSERRDGEVPVRA